MKEEYSHSRKEKNKLRIFAIILAIIIYFSSASVVVYPYIKAQISMKEAEEYTREFKESTAKERSDFSGAVGNVIPKQLTLDDVIKYKNIIPYADMLREMLLYNQEIYNTNQESITGTESFAEQVVYPQKHGLQDGAVGTLYIPSLDAEFPIYLGSTPGHLDKGLAQLTGTSMPTGGKNTNCVLAGHRGWQTGDILKEVEKIQIGEILTLTNPWGKLEYRVSEIQIIKPSDIKDILIKDGRDVITLITCHPYASGGRFRYLVICDRVEDDSNSVEIMLDDSQKEKENIGPGMIAAKSDPLINFSSNQEIFFDIALQYISFAFVAVFPIIALILLKKYKKQDNINTPHG